MHRRLPLYILFFYAIVSRSQLPVGRDTIKVMENSNVLKLAWAGGLNSAMFSQIDLDQDGKLDLVAFDKVDYFAYGIFRCFINQGGVGQTKYIYEAKYNSKFPYVENWAVFHDYNNDGKADLFTATSGGVKVFKNTSIAGNLSFALAKSFLRSNITPTTTPTYATIYSSSYASPGISDIDGDGDLDILTFSSLGIQVEYHKNMAVENSWSLDSLVYQLSESTWGDITENNCAVTLNQYIANNPGNGINNPNKNTAHAGSCLMCFDRDNDGDKDLIIGDISCSISNYCDNGGTTANAHITDTTKLYPNYPAKASTQIIRMNNFPCTYNLDVDNDGKKDLVASPNTINSENFTSVWMYKNIGTGGVSDFQFVKNNFLQDEMIELGEGAFPVLFDVDNDGLLDLIIGNAGYYIINTSKTRVAYYRNTGTLTQPTYSLITRDFAGLDAQANIFALLSLVPTFGDIDNDGDNDMIVADYYGKFHWVENTAGAGLPCNFSIFHYNYFAISPAPSAPFPQLIDVDRDGLLDLLVGTRNGKLSYYKNNGTAAAATFTLITNSFGNVNVKYDLSKYSIDGSCSPFMYDVAGSYKLLCGSISGSIFYYDNIDGNLAGNFNRIDTNVNKINDGPRSAVQYVDINGDGKRDLFVGNYAGGLSFYSSKSTIGIEELGNNSVDNILVYPNPAQDVLEIRSENNFTERTEIILSDVLGKTILTQSSPSNQISLRCGNLDRGIYFLQVNIHSDKKIQSVFKKIILQ